MNSVGAVLKTERERQGRDLAEIAGELCITQRYLRAIEQDDLKSLPGTFFYKSFVRQYAASLGVDESLLQPEIGELCITQRYLRAIEQDDLKSLPGTFFYKSFVRQYAASLGVDESLLQP